MNAINSRVFLAWCNMPLHIAFISPQMVFLLEILLQKKKADANEHQPFSIFNQFYAGITAKFIIAQEKPVIITGFFLEIINRKK